MIIFHVKEMYCTSKWIMVLIANFLSFLINLDCFSIMGKIFELWFIGVMGVNYMNNKILICNS